MTKKTQENVIPLFKKTNDSSEDTIHSYSVEDPFFETIQRNQEKNERIRQKRSKVNEQVIKNYRLKK